MEPATRKERILFTDEELISYNPVTFEENGRVHVSSEAEVGEAVARAREVFPSWAGLSLEERSGTLRRLADVIYQERAEIARSVSRETGKPLVESLAHEVLIALADIDFLTREAPQVLKPQRLPSFWSGWLLGKRGQVIYEPYGVVGAITPWNFPFTLSLVVSVPALLAGNSVVLKPSEYTPLVGEVIRQLINQADFPPGVFQVVQGDGNVGTALIQANVDKIAFIGNTRTGRKILAAAAEHLTPTMLELSGKDAALVLEDAPLEMAAAGIVWGSMFNAGQACTSIERVYVVDSIADRFIDLAKAELQRLRQGREIGPLTSKRQLERVDAQIREAVERGARVLHGGKVERGLFFEPTLMVDVDPRAALMLEETFGPVLPVVRVRDEEEAIDLANASAFGLAASIWTRDGRRALRVARRLRTGMVTINDHSVNYFLPDAPWGGVKDSGFGRYHGRQALLEFVQPKTVLGEWLTLKRRLWWYPYDERAYALWDAVSVLFTSRSPWQKLRGLLRAVHNIDLRRLL